MSTDETPDLDTLLGIGVPQKPLSPQEEVDMLAIKLIEIRAQLETLKAQEQAIEDAIWTRTPDDVGDAAVDGDQYSFVVSRSEQWKWDSQKIEAKLATVPLPHHVKAKYTIEKRKYLAMTDTEQKDWIDALERKPSNPKVSVVQKTQQP